MLAFDRVYFHDQFTPFYKDWLETAMRPAKQPDGSFYIPGSGMCEVGVHWAIGHLHESVVHYLGNGPVDAAVIAEARRLGYGDRVPSERLGDFTPGAFNTNIILEKGVTLNGVTGGGHSTLLAVVEEDDNPDPFQVDPDSIKLMSWEWETLAWTPFFDAVNRGVIYRDIG